jgi:hypothetical protein
VALLNRKWLPPTVVARCCLAIVSLCVLGNVIYTWVIPFNNLNVRD